MEMSIGSHLHWGFLDLQEIEFKDFTAYMKYLAKDLEDAQKDK